VRFARTANAGPQTSHFYVHPSRLARARSVATRDGQSKLRKIERASFRIPSGHAAAIQRFARNKCLFKQNTSVNVSREVLTARRKLTTRYGERTAPRLVISDVDIFERHLCKNAVNQISAARKKRPSNETISALPSWPPFGHLLPRSLSDRETYFFSKSRLS